MSSFVGAHTNDTALVVRAIAVMLDMTSDELMRQVQGFDQRRRVSFNRGDGEIWTMRGPHPELDPMRSRRRGEVWSRWTWLPTDSIPSLTDTSAGLRRGRPGRRHSPGSPAGGLGSPPIRRGGGSGPHRPTRVTVTPAPNHSPRST